MQIRVKNYLVVDAPAKMKKVYAVIPTYNEADNLPRLMAELFALDIPNLKILIVDDDSPDGTGEVAETMRELFQPDVQVIHRHGKKGLGSAYLEGFRAALERGAEFVIQMDADFSHPPASVIELLEQAEHFDVVVGKQRVHPPDPGPAGKRRHSWIQVLDPALPPAGVGPLNQQQRLHFSS
jgi:dolichol-phosphate mannosyltransferase